MKLKIIALSIVLFGFTATAHAAKVAEYGDPVIGNSYAGCSFSLTYSTGGGGYLYQEYTITCPTGGPYQVGVQTQYSPYTTCSFYPGDDSYYVNGSCENWRVYKD